MTACFLGLCREYLSFLPLQIGRALGTFLETPIIAASIVAKAVSLPLVRILVLDLAKLPSQISHPTLVGDRILQRVKFLGLPNQCFAC